MLRLRFRLSALDASGVGTWGASCSWPPVAVRCLFAGLGRGDGGLQVVVEVGLGDGHDDGGTWRGAREEVMLWSGPSERAQRRKAAANAKHRPLGYTEAGAVRASPVKPNSRWNQRPQLARAQPVAGRRWLHKDAMLVGWKRP